MTDELTKQIANIFFAVAKADKKLSFEEYVKISEIEEGIQTYIALLKGIQGKLVPYMEQKS